jgi:methionyl-tRNA synthetase
LGNLVHRTITMIHRYRGGVVPAKADSTYDGVSAAIDEALEDFDFRRATSAVWRIVDEANRAIDATRPWQLAKERREDELDAALGSLYAACVGLATCLEPFLPSAAALIARQCTPVDGVLPHSTPLFPRIEL